MWIDFFHYDVKVVEERQEIELFIKVGALQLTNEVGDTWLFNPRKDNTIILDLHTGKVKNPTSIFCFYPRNNTAKECRVDVLCNDVLGFEFELEQAYEKALFYRIIRSKKNANTK